LTFIYQGDEDFDPQKMTPHISLCRYYDELKLSTKKSTGIQRGEINKQFTELVLTELCCAPCSFREDFSSLSHTVNYLI